MRCITSSPYVGQGPQLIVLSSAVMTMLLFLFTRCGVGRGECQMRVRVLQSTFKAKAVGAITNDQMLELGAALELQWDWIK